MNFKKYITMLTVVMTVSITMLATAYGAPTPELKKDWDISFLGTMQVPAQLEIVDGKDVIEEVMKFSEKASKAYPMKSTVPKMKAPSFEDVSQFFTTNNIGVYQLALKNNGSYNTAILFAGKVPAKNNTNELIFFDKLKNTDSQKQKELHTLILKGIDEAYTKVPDLQNLFQLEIIEFYPFERIISQNVEMIGMGGSVAVRSFKLIQPAAFKIYVINKNAEIYVLGVINSGPDRKMWDDMTKDMLSNMQWN